MITFACTCQHRMTVSDDFAGTDLQCPKCGRLVTVPSPMDLADMNADGTYRVESAPVHTVDDPYRLQELHRTFARTRVDEDGNEIDLRSHAKADDYAHVGVSPAELFAMDAAKPSAPRYDPETGELVRVVDLNLPTAPPPGKRPDPTAGYRPRKRYAIKRLKSVDPLGLAVALFKPDNVIVMGVILLGHFALALISMLPVLGYPIVAAGAMVLLILSISHFGNVIDETGPTCHDELPRPLRNLNLNEDLFGPAFKILFGLLYCYLPALAMLCTNVPTSLRLIIVGLLAVGGTWFAPAVILTIITSGSLANLRPDRVMGVTRAIGPIYLIAITTFIVAVPVYLTGFSATTTRLLSQVIMDVGNGVTAPKGPGLGASQLEQLLATGPFVWTLLIVGIIAMHYFTWLLGRSYRVHHRSFPWVNQGRRSDLEEEEAAPQGFEVLPAPVQPLAAIPTGPIRAIPLDSPQQVH